MPQGQSDKILELPHSTSAEQATLGAALFSSEARDQLLDILTYDDFYEERHRILFKAIAGFKEANNNNTTIDRVTFGNYLRSTGELEKCGGIAYIESLSESAPIPSNAVSYAKIVKDNSLRRKTIKSADEIKVSSLNETEDIEDTVDKACSTFNDLQTYGTSTDEFMNVQLLTRKLQEKIEKMNDLGVVPGIKTGFDYLDKKIGGFKESQYVIVAARPSCGKTAFALSCMSNMLNMPMEYVAQDENGQFRKHSKEVKIGFFSLEMPSEDILKRMFSMRSLVPYELIAQNRLGQDPDSELRVRLYESVTRFSEVANRLYIYDSTAMSIQNIKAAARKLKRQEDVDIFFIDYFSRIDTQGLGRGRMQAYEQWSIVSRELKNLAADLKVPIVCLTQLNREAEKSKPTLANLRDTGAIEQDADIVIMLHNPERNGEMPQDNTENAPTRHYHEILGNNEEITVNVKKVTNIQTMIAKHRNGETGSCDLCLLGDFVRFVDQETVS